MRISRICAVTALAGLLAVLCLAPVASQEQDAGPTGPSPYDVVEGWHKPFAKQGFAHGGNSGLFVESRSEINADTPVIVVGQNGLKDQARVKVIIAAAGAAPAAPTSQG